MNSANDNAAHGITLDEAHTLPVGDVCKVIAKALRLRSGKPWSVTHGRGTAYGWITIHAPPRRRVEPCGYMADDDRAELARLLGLDVVHHQGVSVAASSDYRREYLERARTGASTIQAQPYWD